MSFCQICNKEFEINYLVPLALLKNSILDFINTTHKNLDNSGFICLTDIHDCQAKFSRKQNSNPPIFQFDSFSPAAPLPLESDLFPDEHAEKPPLGDRLADHMAELGGSWVFILSFLFFMGLWIFLNSYNSLNFSIDPYPYILLNLILSCLAAIQAPIIMMSQNRQEKKDRLHAKMDYIVNLKSEHEIRRLNEKLDHYFNAQNIQFDDLTKNYNELLVLLKKPISSHSAPKDLF